MPRMPDMTPTSPAAAVVSRTGKIIKKVKSIVRNRVSKLEFTQPKADFSERGLALKGLKFYFFNR